MRGNTRACVLTEPLWGIPFNLYAPYVSVYMRSFDLSDTQIGLITSIGLSLQVITALFSGVITDKLGRKRATLIFDILAWSVPSLLWAVSQNFYYFVAAAVVNSLWRVTMNSWTCLLVEDTPEEQLVDVYSWIYISGLLAVFFTPIAGLLINQFSLVPTMRGLYIFAFVMMTTKFIVMNAFVKETRQGLVRMQETRDQSVFSVLSEYRGVFRQILVSPRTLYVIGIMLVMSISNTINNTFWSLYVTERVMIPKEHLAIYPFARSALMLLFFFLVMPRIREMNFKRPMLIGFTTYLLGQIILITTPQGSYIPLLVSTFLEACSVATVNVQLDRMLVIDVDPQERARILAIIYVIVIVMTAPFGWIGGQLSEINKNLPFLLNMGLFAIGALLVYLSSRQERKSASLLS